MQALHMALEVKLPVVHISVLVATLRCELVALQADILRRREESDAMPKLLPFHCLQFSIDDVHALLQVDIGMSAIVVPRTNFALCRKYGTVCHFDVFVLIDGVRVRVRVICYKRLSKR